MKLLCFGASGGTGRQLVEQALERGHAMTAFVRRPESMQASHARLDVVAGDIEDAGSIERAMPGHDAVLSALGVNVLKENSILSEGTRRILDAMERHGVRRFVCESSLGVGDSRGQLGPLYNWIFLPLMLRHVFRDKQRQEDLIRASRSDWTIVRPGALTHGPRTGTYAVGVPRVRSPRVSRADVASFMLDLAEGNTHVHEAVGVWHE